MQITRGSTAAMTQNYSAGNKIYGAGRSNPTSGTVDPTGYVDRSFNNSASQRRSGLAQAAISRRLGISGGGAPIGGALPTVQNIDQRQALIQQNFRVSPEGHYIPLTPPGGSVAAAAPQIDLQSAIQRRLQGGLNGPSN